MTRRLVIMNDEPVLSGRRPVEYDPDGCDFGSKLPAELVRFAQRYDDDDRPGCSPVPTQGEGPNGGKDTGDD